MMLIIIGTILWCKGHPVMGTLLLIEGFAYLIDLWS
jgi:hypothetical protein